MPPLGFPSEDFFWPYEPETIALVFYRSLIEDFGTVAAAAAAVNVCEAGILNSFFSYRL